MESKSHPCLSKIWFLLCKNHSRRNCLFESYGRFLGNGIVVSSQIKNHFRPGKVRHPKSIFDKLYVNNGKLKLTTKERKNLLTIIMPNKYNDTTQRLI